MSSPFISFLTDFGGAESAQLTTPDVDRLWITRR